jgi:hypothetical protein
MLRPVTAKMLSPTSLTSRIGEVSIGAVAVLRRVGMNAVTASIIGTLSLFVGEFQLGDASASIAASPSKPGVSPTVETSFRVDKRTVIRVGESSPTKAGEVQIIQEQKDFLEWRLESLFFRNRVCEPRKLFVQRHWNRSPSQRPSAHWFINRALRANWFIRRRWMSESRSSFLEGRCA